MLLVLNSFIKKRFKAKSKDNIIDLIKRQASRPHIKTVTFF